MRSVAERPKLVSRGNVPPRHVREKDFGWRMTDRTTTMYCILLLMFWQKMVSRENLENVWRFDSSTITGIAVAYLAKILLPEHLDIFGI